MKEEKSRQADQNQAANQCAPGKPDGLAAFLKESEKARPSAEEAYASGLRCYVIQTISRQEQTLMDLMKSTVSAGLMQDLYVVKREMKKHLGGQWLVITELMFPGYVFVVTPDADALFYALRTFPRMSKLLYEAKFEFIPLSREEWGFIDRIGKYRGDHTFGISRVTFLDPMELDKAGKPADESVVFHKGDHVLVLDDDLKEFRGEIVGMDLRKRKAMIQTNLFGGAVIHVGIDLVSRLDGGE